MREIITQKKLNEIQRTKGPGPGRSIESTPQVPDDYFSRVLKLVPAEVVSFYLALIGIIGSGGPNVNTEALLWIIFFVGLIGTPLYAYKITKVGDHLQVGISTIAFVVWAFAIGGPFATITWYQPIYGSVLLPIFVLFVPLIIPK